MSSDLPPIKDEFMAGLVRDLIESVDESVRKIGLRDPWFAAQLKEHANAMRQRLEEWEQARP